MNKYFIFLFLVLFTKSFAQINNQGIYTRSLPINNFNNCLEDNCNLVINGGFEEYISIPTDQAQINYACNWSDLGTSVDYYHTNSPNYYFQIPCNLFGYQNSLNTNNNGYAGMHIIKNSGGILNNIYTEIVYSKLKEPLLPNTNYQLTFEVSKV